MIESKHLINRAALRRHVRRIRQLCADVELAATRLTLAVVTPLKSPPPETPAVTPIPLS